MKRGGLAQFALFCAALLCCGSALADDVYECKWSGRALYRHDSEPRKVGGTETVTAGSEGEARRITRQLASRSMGSYARLVGELQISCHHVGDE